MNSGILFERDILYPTDNSGDPGSIHIQVFGPDRNIKIPVVIEAKSNHSPLNFIDSIVRIMQSDIFDRIFIDVRKNVDIYLRTTAENKAEYGSHNFVKISYSEDGIKTEGAEL